MGEPRTFTCHLCGHTYRTTTTLAEMDAEVVDLYGEPVPDSELVSLCDGCYERAVTVARSKGWIS